MAKRRSFKDPIPKNAPAKAEPLGWVYVSAKSQGVRADPKTGGIAHALIDTGASGSAISESLAAFLDGPILKTTIRAAGRGDERFKVIRVRLAGPRCRWIDIHAAVSDELVSCAGEGIDMVLGTDYLNKNKVKICLAENPSEAGFSCDPEDT